MIIDQVDFFFSFLIRSALFSSTAPSPPQRSVLFSVPRHCPGKSWTLLHYHTYAYRKWRIYDLSIWFEMQNRIILHDMNAKSNNMQKDYVLCAALCYYSMSVLPKLENSVTRDFHLTKYLFIYFGYIIIISSISKWFYSQKSNFLPYQKMHNGNYYLLEFETIIWESLRSTVVRCRLVRDADSMYKNPFEWVAVESFINLIKLSGKWQRVIAGWLAIETRTAASNPHCVRSTLIRFRIYVR